VSIERQISVSRSQKELLKKRLANTAATTNANAAVNSGRLFDSKKKPMTPKFVNAVTGNVIKSERVVFERA
jgi:hypothetical protein